MKGDYAIDSQSLLFGTDKILDMYKQQFYYL